MNWASERFFDNGDYAEALLGPFDSFRKRRMVFYFLTLLLIEFYCDNKATFDFVISALLAN